MKILRVALVALLLMSPSAGRAAVDFDFFYDELSPYGDWVEVEDYGYCFQPYEADGDWRPYTDGYWADSDEGWVWVSNEPHGWATYHYGRWANVTDRGWVWVPGYEWGPGWVSWRENDDYVGWAPLPPQVGWRPQNGIRFGDNFGFGDVGPSYYNFIEPRYFGYPRMRDYVLPYDRNVDLLDQTMNVTDIMSVLSNGRSFIANRGPNRDFLRQRSERPIRWLKIEREDDLTAEQLRNRRMRNQIEGDRYRVASPKVERAEGARPKKVAGRVTKDQIDDGYARVADRHRAEEVRKRIRAQAADPKSQKQRGAQKPDGADAQKKPAEEKSERKNDASPDRRTDIDGPNNARPQPRDPDGRPARQEGNGEESRAQSDRKGQDGGRKNGGPGNGEGGAETSDRPRNPDRPQTPNRSDDPEKPKPRPQQPQEAKPQERNERPSPKPQGEQKRQGNPQSQKGQNQEPRQEKPENKPKPQQGRSDQPKPEKKSAQQPQKNKPSGPEKKEERKKKD